MPAHGLGIRFAGGALRRRNFGEFEPRMIRKQAHQPLTYQTGCAEDAGA
jgi:hypothetical protein